VKHQERLSALRVWRLLMRNKSAAANSLFSLALLANLLLLLRSSLCLTTEGCPYVWSKRFCSESARSTLAGDDQSCCNASMVFELSSRALLEQSSERRLRDALERCPSEPEMVGYFSVMGSAASPWPEIGQALEVTMVVVGAFIILSTTVTLTIHYLQSGELRVQKRWKRVTGLHDFKEVLERRRSSRLFQLKYLLVTPWFRFSDRKLLYLSMPLIAAILAMAHAPWWYCWHLFDIISKSRDLRNVWKAVSQNVTAILMTLVFTLIVVYVYAIFGYMALSDSFSVTAYPDEVLPACSSLWICFVMAISEGLRGSDIGVFMSPRKPHDVAELSGEDLALFYLQFVYQITFWFVVIALLLNVVFGIIIDSFGELRMRNLAIKHDMENNCFICGVDRFTLDTKGGGFPLHIRMHHNMWLYLYMIVYLREKDPTEYNGWEQHVANMLAQEDVGFFPRNDAIALKEVKNREEAESRRYMGQVASTAERVADIAASVEKLLEVMTGVASRVNATAAGQAG